MLSFYLSNRRRSLQNRSFAFSPPILALFLLGTYCFGQAGKTELFGTITDPSSQPVATASQIWSSAATPFSVGLTGWPA